MQLSMANGLCSVQLFACILFLWNGIHEIDVEPKPHQPRFLKNTVKHFFASLHEKEIKEKSSLLLLLLFAFFTATWLSSVIDPETTEMDLWGGAVTWPSPVNPRCPRTVCCHARLSVGPVFSHLLSVLRCQHILLSVFCDDTDLRGNDVTGRTIRLKWEERERENKTCTSTISCWYTQPGSWHCPVWHLYPFSKGVVLWSGAAGGTGAGWFHCWPCCAQTSSPHFPAESLRRASEASFSPCPPKESY